MKTLVEFWNISNFTLDSLDGVCGGARGAPLSTSPHRVDQRVTERSCVCMRRRQRSRVHACVGLALEKLPWVQLKLLRTFPSQLWRVARWARSASTRATRCSSVSATHFLQSATSCGESTLLAPFWNLLDAVLLGRGQPLSDVIASSQSSLRVTSGFRCLAAFIVELATALSCSFKGASSWGRLRGRPAFPVASVERPPRFGCG